MLIVQTLSLELGKIIEKRLEMIIAHEKFGVEIKKAPCGGKISD
jgi:hypothetical protein